MVEVFQGRAFEFFFLVIFYTSQFKLLSHSNFSQNTKTSVRVRIYKNKFIHFLSEGIHQVTHI